MFRFLNILFDSIWKLFSITWPGTQFSIGLAFLGIAFAHVALKIFTSFFDMPLGASSGSSSSGGRSSANAVNGGNSRYISIPEQRRLDSK